MSDRWIALAQLMLPVLVGLLLMLIMGGVLTIWQDRRARTWRNVWFTLMYLSFFVLCVSRSLHLPLTWVVVSYMLLVLFLFPCVWCEWWNFIQFLREKNTKFMADEAGHQLMTLDKLASDDVHAVLDATPIDEDSGSGHVALDATPIRPKKGEL